MNLSLRTWGFIIAGVGVAVLLTLLAITSAQLKACKAGRAADRAAYVAEQASVARQHTEEKARTEARYAQIQKEQESEIAKDRAANRSALAQWMREQAAKRPSSSTHLPTTATAAGKPDTPASEAFVPVTDLERCSDAFTVAEGWQSWWLSLSSQEPR